MAKFQNVLLASDLDGTLLDSGRNVSKENIRAITAFIEQGGVFTVATGRSKNSARGIFGKFPVNAPVILCNGAVLYDLDNDRPVHVEYIPPEAKALIPEIADMFPAAGVEVFLMDAIYMVRCHEVSRRHFSIIGEPFKLTAPEDVPEGGWIKIFITEKEEELLKIEAYMQEKYGHAYSITRSETEYLEIFSRRADKGVALLRLADSLGIPRDRVFAVGDHCNDLPLLKAAAGAFVPENGLPAVKALGQTVASCDGHAVADVIRRLGAIL